MPNCDHQRVTDEQLKDLYDHLTLLYGQVAKAAPKALIVVTGYPYLFESDPENPNPIVTAFNAATAALNQTIAAAVKDTHDVNGVNIIYVDVTEQFTGHGIGSDDPFMNGPTAVFPDAFHPNGLATAHMPRPSQLRYETR